MRRANGTGSVVKLSGNRRRPWAVRIPVRDSRGRVRQRYLSYHARAAEAQAALDAWARDHHGPQPGGDTLGEIYERWSARSYPRLNPASVASHKAAWGRVGALAGREIRAVTLDDLQGILDQDAARGLSQSSVNNDRILMAALYRYAMERELVARDITRYLESPRIAPKHAKGVLTQAQLDALAALAGEGDRWARTAMLLCYTGFRVSELLALTPADYHPEGGYLQGGMKTAAGRGRIVPVHPRVQPWLEDFLAQSGARIICRPDGGPVSAAAYRKEFAALMARIGAEGATPHWCRHTCATRLHQAGADPLAIKRILGHADQSVTEHYTHLDAAFLRAELEKMP